MGQLESLRELDIAESKKKIKERKIIIIKYAIVVHSNGNFSES
jgi:hypothetical protein